MAIQRRIKRRKIGYKMIGVMAIAVCFVLLLLALNFKMSSSVGILGSVGVMAMMFAIKVGIDWAGTRALSSMETLRKGEKDALRGAEAEEDVAALLESFCQKRHVLIHDVKSAFGNIDHVVLTEAGNIFLIETKGHGGKASLEGQVILVNGKPTEKDFIKQTLSNTYWLKEKLDHIIGNDVWVNSLIVFANAFVAKPYKAKGIGIINKRFLIKTLEDLDRKKASKLWSHAEEIKASLQELAVPFPSMPELTYYLFLNEEVQGPFSSEEIKAFVQGNSVTLSTSCCVCGTEEWQTVGILIY